MQRIRNTVPRQPFFPVQEGRLRSDRHGRPGSLPFLRFFRFRPRKTGFRRENTLPVGFAPETLRLRSVDGTCGRRGGMADFRFQRKGTVFPRGKNAYEGLFHGPQDDGKDGPFVAEADFIFGRMHVDVHFLRGHVHEQDRLRVLFGQQTALVGFTHGLHEQLVVDCATVDVEEQTVCAGLGLPGRRGQTVRPETARRAIERNERFCNRRRPDGGQPLDESLPSRKPQGLASPGEKDKPGLGMYEREPGQQLLRALEFGRGCFQKFQPGRNGGEQVAHFHNRAAMQATGTLFDHAAMFHMDKGRLIPVGAP